MALIDRVVGKNIPKSPAPESVHPTRTTRVPWGPQLVVGPDHAKRRARHFFAELFFNGGRNEMGPWELHRCAEARGKSA
ncbi:hypothetical protein [Bradyrhizobium yuanmingense]|uniref:hypothetical protein n=1 Tax=Bradyrhizobium yuanmingense TaxID=108015 RepID=UPI001CD5CDB3|nr:hypothetical protein [Bradyrhizobium yuanmingense]MCA1528776.1 hypothetical protein [Bradyrhizobium yuanmingense]